MKSKITFWLFFLLTAFITSCSSEDSNSLSSEESLEKELKGNWYFSEENEIFSFFIQGQGIGYVDLYEYLNKEWKTSKKDLQYTVSDNNIVVNIRPNYTWSGTIGITGNSLSFTKDDKTIMMTKYDGGTTTINKLKKGIEDNWLEVTPTDTINEESFWHTEEDIRMYLSGMYASLKEFNFSQLNLEHIRLTGKSLQNHPHQISPYSKHVAEVWEKGYRVINMSNLLASHLNNLNNSYLQEEKRIVYLDQAVLLRSFVYYNLAHLWGKAVYITQPIDEMDMKDFPIYPQKEIFNQINADLKKINSIVAKQYYMNNDVAIALQAEIALWGKDKVKALQLLKDCKAEYTCPIHIEDIYYDFYHKLFGDELCIYSNQVIDLLTEEASGNFDTLPTNWQSFKSKWGYWAMLKRTQQAIKISGCKEHELVMPIPQKEIDLNQNITQNPGY